MPGTFRKLTVHLVFSTKCRVPLITATTRELLFPYFGGIVKGLGGSLVAAGGMPDHVHLLVWLPTSLSVADAVRTIKANSSKFEL